MSNDDAKIMLIVERYRRSLDVFEERRAAVHAAEDALRAAVAHRAACEPELFAVKQELIDAAAGGRYDFWENIVKQPLRKQADGQPWDDKPGRLNFVNDGKGYT